MSEDLTQSTTATSAEDLSFLKKLCPTIGGKVYPIPRSSLSPDARSQRRLAWRNERSLYLRDCALSGKRIVSAYSPDKPLTVYSQEMWWRDDWSGLAYGREYNPTRSFFDQFSEVLREVPHLALINTNSENSDFCHCMNGNKNCYMCFGGNFCECCLHCKDANYCLSSIDCLMIRGCELCYECVNCRDCYFLTYSQDCQNCSFSSFLNDCRNCTNCFGCVGLRNEEFCLFNQKLSKQRYSDEMEQFLPLTYDKIKTAQYKLSQLSHQYHYRFRQSNNEENCSGNYIYNSKNCFHCFDIHNVEQGRYLCNVYDTKTSMDCSNSDSDSELLYESMSIAGYGLYFCVFSWFCSNSLYCYNCHNSEDLFGCVGLKRERFCILNKQYSEKEYYQTVEKIICHMRRSGEWGEFFPMKISPFAYNETIAQDYFPINKDTIHELECSWRDLDDDEIQSTTYSAPESIKTVDDTVLKEIFACSESGKQFKIQKLELELHRKLDIPLPTLCPHERHKRRIQQRPSRKLHRRNCSVNGKEILTAYDTDRYPLVVSGQEYERLMHG